MYSFLRKMRRRFLSDNKFTRYLAYAIGEIILVVIGILIAIQLNDIKKAKDLRLEMDQLLSSVYQDLEADSTRMVEVETYYLKHTAAIQTLIGVQEGTLKADNDELGNQLLRLFFFTDYKPVRSAYESIISGGKLQNLIDKELANLLTRYYNIDFLEVTTNVYGDLLVGFDPQINNSPNLVALDRSFPQEILKRNIPNYTPLENVTYRSDFSLVLQEPWMDDFLVNCLNQSVFVFNSLTYTKVLNQELREMINTRLAKEN